MQVFKVFGLFVGFSHFIWHSGFYLIYLVITRKLKCETRIKSARSHVYGCYPVKGQAKMIIYHIIRAKFGFYKVEFQAVVTDGNKCRAVYENSDVHGYKRNKRWRTRLAGKNYADNRSRHDHKYTYRYGSGYRPLFNLSAEQRLKGFLIHFRCGIQNGRVCAARPECFDCFLNA